ncbi:MAG: T9SS type A sorting domain-containing protein, partial [Flavobacteriaceae bacterium]|nr:T9SS type A sorting domain-containing protein [Flavobacteriaceae bacterium]
TNETLSTRNVNLKQAFTIKGSNIVTNTLLIQINPLLLNSKYLTVYNTLGQKITTVKTQNINLLRLNVSNLSNGVYYIVASYDNLNPLKFIKSN